MSSSSSPGFDTVLPPFIMMRANLSLDVMAEGLDITMCWLHTFHNSSCLCKTARIPSSWKAAKHAPIIKKGTVTHPSNYRMLAVNNILYRLYTNVLHSMVEDWCAKYNIIPESVNLAFFQAATPYSHFLS
eukprot:798567-Pelagomonas_calceolata.AAC.1